MPDPSPGPQPSDGRVCPHLLADPTLAYAQRFTGVGRVYDLVCGACQGAGAADLRPVSAERFAALGADGDWDGIVGRPEVRTRDTPLRFGHRDLTVPELGKVTRAEPVAGRADTWAVLTAAGEVVTVDVRRGAVTARAAVPPAAMDVAADPVLRASSDGAWVAVAERLGTRGVVLAMADGRVAMPLARGDYREEVSSFPLAFAGRLLIHGTAWNRLDGSDPADGRLRTPRGPTEAEPLKPAPDHYLDYFHCTLAVSPGGRYVADAGWAWHPIGVVRAWDLTWWLGGNPWESEDGPSAVDLHPQGYRWDGPLCWVGEHELAAWGYGRDDGWLIPAACVYDVRTGRRTRWFPGPPRGGWAAGGGRLFAWDAAGTSVWDALTGERLAVERDLVPLGYHPLDGTLVSSPAPGTLRVTTLVTRPPSRV